MFSAELPSEMKQLLTDVTPNFDENLKRAFRNEAVRLQRKQNTNRYVHQLDDVLLSVDDTKMYIFIFHALEQLYDRS
ncbi:hypothetical protein Zmor_024158 [Zophobas morio]|uniref:Uncharacterized protein n=1 Tax=Zophobas morio TaxID=2755281 RepID=A0AA38I4H8_9CUCU|nr:hypothetical protein Zmor_024158 [Zophobas morio]